MKTIHYIWITLAFTVSTMSLSAFAGYPNQYNVAWDSPSRDSFGSMPLPGSRGAGANVWVSEGSLWIYLAHNGAYDEQGRLLKLGCVRLTPTGADWGNPVSFQQTQTIADGTIGIASTCRDGTRLTVRLRFLGESLLVDTAASRPLAWTVAYGTWRDSPKKAKLDWFTGPEEVGADTVSVVNGKLRFVHRNGASMREQALAEQQRVPVKAMVNLLPYRNFGGALVASGVLVFSEPKPVAWQTWQGKAWTGRTSVAEKQTIAVTLGAGKNASVETWETTARALLGVPARKAAEKAEDSRWREFWDRSHVFVSSNDPNEPATGPAYQAGRNYQLFRLMRACDAGGELPLKFNGFYNVDAWPNDTDHPLHAEWSSGYDYPGKEASPDFRIWGQLFFGQNQRWLGLPTLADGDADLLAPSTAFYRNRHPIARARAANLHAAGACYVEPLGVEGTCGVVPAADGLCSAVHLTFHFSMGLEHAWMTLLGHSILGTKIDADIPWMVDEIRFFDSFYRAQNKKNTGSELGADGRLVLFPLNGLELISGGINTIETVAGLRRVTAGLLELKELPASDRAFLKKVRQTLPELPTMQRDGKTVFAPAVKWSGEHNSTEFPEMCAVFPYRLAGLLRPETLDMARDTWSLLPSRGDCPQFSPTKLIDRAWQPTIASMAGLGWASEAKRRLVAKITDRLPSYRYPAFFATGDGRPDFNHAASGFVGLQEMLMQCDSKPGGKILLLPAWPSTWDVDFKLHAPQQTTVECVVKRGKVVKLKVTPESRRKDVEIIGPVPEPPLPVSQGKKVMASSTFRLPGYDADKAVDGDLSTRWATDAGQGSGWLEVDLGKPTTVSRAVIQEQSFSQTALFAVESQLADGSWKTLAEGTTIGASKELKFTPTTAQKFRLHIFESKLVPGGGATIDEFQLFEK